MPNKMPGFAVTDKSPAIEALQQAPVDSRNSVD